MDALCEGYPVWLMFSAELCPALANGDADAAQLARHAVWLRRKAFRGPFQQTKIPKLRKVFLHVIALNDEDLRVCHMFFVCAVVPRVGVPMRANQVMLGKGKDCL